MFYRQSIALFGIVIPLVLAVVVVGGALMVSSNMADEFAEKKSHYTAYDRNKIGALQLEVDMGKKRSQVAEWNKHLATETKSTVNNTLKKITAMLPPKEFMVTNQNSLSNIGGIGAASAQKSSQIQLRFRGTFRTMQRAFLELETRMPQLQLQDIKMDPEGTSSHLLNFDVTYSAWEQN